MKRTLLACLLGAVAAPAGAADFAKDVKPVLAKHCVSCHGPDKQRASLRLDTARAALAGGSSGPAVARGRSADSLLVKAMLGADDAVKAMPPKGDRVSAADIALVRRWIDEGAKTPAEEAVVASKTKTDHWSFQPVVRPREPAVKDAAWPVNGIDRFILARLEKEGVRPSPGADPITLLRRVHLDLTGIPPTPVEVEAFLANRRPGAYERVVDRLLTSPHYGERWARHWLDQARYADSNGYSIDAARAIWKYRDWVIASLNADVPFSRFTVEQLAGDLLPRATLEQRTATGFHRNTQINQEGGIDLEQFRVEAVIDRVNTTSTVWLGLTVGCAQCHDHKFDPISQKDYYQLYAFFNNSDDPKIDLVSPEINKRRVVLQAEAKKLEKALFDIERLNQESMEQWVNTLSPEARLTLPKRLQTIANLPPNGRNAKQIAEMMAAYRSFDQIRHVVGGAAGPFALAAQSHLFHTRLSLEKRIVATRKKTPAADSTMVVNERMTPRLSFIQLGGDFLRKGATVAPAVPAALPQLPAGPKINRLDLAEWMVDGKNPLTGRVLVNRLWQVYFGLGLVETDNDFGTQGTKPSHPELLDWLADEFVRRGWSLKEIHRLIVTSASYRQSSATRPDLRTLDARNILLARQNRLRLEAEVVRDVALSTSGLLTTTVGGPGVFPPQPAGVYSLTQVPKNWVADAGANRFRRGLYTYFWRSAPHPSLTVFDAPDATAACTRRNRSNTPLQALTMLNDLAYLECARSLAARVLLPSPPLRGRGAEGEGVGRASVADASGSRSHPLTPNPSPPSTGERGTGRDGDRLTRAFRLTLARRPNETELRVLGDMLTRQREALESDAKEAKSLVGDTAVKGVATAEQAAWVQVARVLLNLDEFITRE